MGVNIYRSSDSGAPAFLLNTAGTLIAILDACLVNGYGAKAAAGWTKAYSGTNKAAYRMNTAAPATGFYLRVDDSATSPARIVGYETMSDVDTGTNPFPTAVQVSGGLYVFKPTASANRGQWIVIADERSFYFYYEGSTSGRWYGWFFGDIVPTNSADAYNCLIAAAATSTTTPAAQDFYSVTNNNSVLRTGHYLARDYSGVTLSSQCGKVANQAGSTYGDGGYPYPNTSDGGIILDVVYIVDTPSNASLRSVRGFMPGQFNPLHTTPANDGDTFSGKGNLAGKTFLITAPDYSANGRIVTQINDSWR